MQSTPVFLPREFHGQRSLTGYSSWGCEESDMTEQPYFHFHPSMCEIIPHCDFDCISPMISDIKHLFHKPVYHLCVFFGKMFVQILCPFRNCFFMLRYVSIFSIFWTLIPYHICHCKYLLVFHRLLFHCVDSLHCSGKAF